MYCSQPSAPDEKVIPEQLPSFELGFADYHQALILLMDDSHFQLQARGLSLIFKTLALTPA